MAERPLNVAWSCMPSPARRECRHPRHGPFPQWTEPASRGRCPFFRWLPQLCKPLVDARHPAPVALHLARPVPGGGVLELQLA